MIHSGVPEAFFDPDAAAVERVRGRYGLQRPFVLFVGTIEPRKNLDVLMSAYEELPASTREAFELVIAGPSGWAAAETKARLRTVRYLGYVPEPDLAPLTAGATVFAYPSLYEGFGFPVAQAMAAGVPVITSNISSLPEIAGWSGCPGGSMQPGGVACRTRAAARLAGAAREDGGRREIAGTGIPVGEMRRQVDRVFRKRCGSANYIAVITKANVRLVPRLLTSSTCRGPGVRV